MSSSCWLTVAFIAFSGDKCLHCFFIFLVFIIFLDSIRRYLNDNALQSLPEGIFDALGNLEKLCVWHAILQCKHMLAPVNAPICLSMMPFTCPPTTSASEALTRCSELCAQIIYCQQHRKPTHPILIMIKLLQYHNELHKYIQ